MIELMEFEIVDRTCCPLSKLYQWCFRFLKWILSWLIAAQIYCSEKDLLIVSINLNLY